MLFAAELTAPRKLAKALAALSQSKTKDFQTFVKFFQSAGSPLSWFPEAPSISERSTGRTMVPHTLCRLPSPLSSPMWFLLLWARRVTMRT